MRRLIEFGLLCGILLAAGCGQGGVRRQPIYRINRPTKLEVVDEDDQYQFRTNDLPEIEQTYSRYKHKDPRADFRGYVYKAPRKEMRIHTIWRNGRYLILDNRCVFEVMPANYVIAAQWHDHERLEIFDDFDRPFPYAVSNPVRNEAVNTRFVGMR